MSDASIHYHFGGRAQLLSALVDAISADFEPPAAHPDWRGWLRDFSHRARQVLRSHPGAADYMLVAGPAEGRQFGIIERALSVLQAGGVEAREAWLIYATTVNYVLRHVQSQEAHAAKTDAASRADQRIARTLEASPAPDMPRLRAVAAAGGLADFDELFDYGLEALLRGFEGGDPAPD